MLLLLLLMVVVVAVAVAVLKWQWCSAHVTTLPITYKCFISSNE
jgi:hypothetical protein